jgi:hypothetical protein
MFRDNRLAYWVAVVLEHIDKPSHREQVTLT